MPDHKHVRPWHEALAKTGAQAPFELDIRTPVQSTVQIEDLGRLFKPTPFMQVSAGSTKAAVAARTSIPVEWEILSPGGAWVTHWTSDAASILYAVESTRIVVLDGLIITVPWSVKGFAGVLDPPVQSVARVGAGSGSPFGPADGFSASLFLSMPNAPEIYVPFGKFVGVGGVLTNSQFGATIMIREVPSGFTP